MKRFGYYQPTEIHFGTGRIAEVGQVTKKYGNRCLIVTVPVFPALREVLDRVQKALEKADIVWAHFDGVVANPITDSITAGATVAKEFRADVVLGLGGGSSMDSAKAIAVEATHEGTCWDYLWFSKTQPTDKTLPVIAVSTTSGTGSQVTQVAVVTNSQERNKSALYNAQLYPKSAIVDPELMITVPQKITACTGFDVFTHAFESWLHPNSSPYIAMMAKEAISLVLEYLPSVYLDGSDLAGREALAFADTLAGLCIANAGVTLPHGMAMAMGGMYPHLPHGKALALVYPAFTRFTYEHSVTQFAYVGRVLNPELHNVSDLQAARMACDEMDRFLRRIALYQNLKQNGIPENELDALAEQCMVLPDYKANPRVASPDEMRRLLGDCYSRKVQKLKIETIEIGQKKSSEKSEQFQEIKNNFKNVGSYR